MWEPCADTRNKATSSGVRAGGVFPAVLSACVSCKLRNETQAGRQASRQVRFRLIEGGLSAFLSRASSSSSPYLHLQSSCTSGAVMATCRLSFAMASIMPLQSGGRIEDYENVGRNCTHLPSNRGARLTAIPFATKEGPLPPIIPHQQHSHIAADAPTSAVPYTCFHGRKLQPPAASAHAWPEPLSLRLHF